MNLLIWKAVWEFSYLPSLHHRGKDDKVNHTLNS